MRPITIPFKTKKPTMVSFLPEEKIPEITTMKPTLATYKGMTPQIKTFKPGYTLEEIDYLEYLEGGYKTIVGPEAKSVIYAPKDIMPKILLSKIPTIKPITSILNPNENLFSNSPSNLLKN